MSSAPISLLWTLVIIIVVIIVLVILIHVLFAVIAVGPLAYAYPVHDGYISAENYKLLKTLW